jgi:hypothetical protein
MEERYDATEEIYLDLWINERDSTSFFYAAMSAFSKEDYRTCLERLKQMDDANSNLNLPYEYYMALCFHKLGMEQEACLLLEEALSSNKVYRQKAQKVEKLICK